MVSTKILVLFGLVLCLLCLVEAKPAPISEDGLVQTTNVINEPALAPAPAAAVSHDTVLHVTVAPEVLKVEPTAAAAAAESPLTTTIAPAITEPAKELSPGSTLAPAHIVAGSTVKPIVVIHTTVLPTIAATTTHINGSKTEACTGFCDYLKPICESLDKISAKQMFKIQTQFKQFVLKTNGKMSLCLVDHYQLDPTFKPISHNDLSAICASRKIAGNGKGSFEAFQTCAANHWDPELDQELAAIKAARVDSTNHQHTESKVVAANIEHDEEELSMISAVVNKVLGQGGSLNEKNSDVKVIDVSGNAGKVAPITTTSNATIASVSHHDKTATTISPKELLKDPNNTVMVFVDDKIPAVAPKTHFDTSVHITDSTTVKPAAILVANSTTTGHVSTIKPANSTSTNVKIEKSTHLTNITTTVSPSLSTKAPAINGTTIKPVVINATTTTTTTVTPTTLEPTVKSSNVTSSISSSNSSTSVIVPLSTKSPVASTTLAPTKAATTSTTTTTTTTTTTALPITTTTKAPATTVKPTLKPIETLEQILHRQENERLVLDTKLKAERTKAIAQLKKQEVSPQTAAADAKIHQREHERQMTIDPIGHTIKHQQYEASKQRKLNSNGSKQ